MRADRQMVLSSLSRCLFRGLFRLEAQLMDVRGGGHNSAYLVIVHIDRVAHRGTSNLLYLPAHSPKPAAGSPRNAAPHWPRSSEILPRDLFAVAVAFA